MDVQKPFSQYSQTDNDDKEDKYYNVNSTFA